MNTVRADQLQGMLAIWHPYGNDPGVLTGVVAGPAGDGMVALTAAELDEPLHIAGDWPVDFIT